jgi:hypothetical protein
MAIDQLDSAVITQVPTTTEPRPTARVESRRARLEGTVRDTQAGIETALRQLPATVDATRAGAQATTGALQTLPDSTLRGLVVGSIGLYAGLRFAGAPRVLRLVALVPALVSGAAIALRPDGPGEVSSSR